MKLLATDYDGTLKYASHIMPEDLEAIQDWKQAGNMFVIVTGRSMESIEQQVKENDLPVDYYVTNNGGMVFDKECLLIIWIWLPQLILFMLLKTKRGLPVL